MHGRYPEDSNIIDFIYIKLISLAEYYHAIGNEAHADACYNALDDYLSDIVDIYFRDGMPYVINIKEDSGDPLAE